MSPGAHWITTEAGHRILIGGGPVGNLKRGGTVTPMKAYGAMPGKGDWNGHGMAELIRLAGHHGLDREQTKQLMGRMNLHPAPNTVYIQHKRGTNHESLPKLSDAHAAEFAQHLQAVKGGELPPTKVTPVKPPSVNTRVAEFVRSWGFGTEGRTPQENYQQLHQQIHGDPELAKHLGQYRPTQPIKVYRAAKAGETHELRSWGTNKEAIRGMVELDPSRTLIERTVQPHEVLFSHGHLPAALQKTSDTGVGEVVVMKGNALQHINRVRGETPTPEIPKPVEVPKPVKSELHSSTGIAAAQMEARSHGSFEQFSAQQGKRWEEAAKEANDIQVRKGLTPQDYRVAMVPREKVRPTQTGEDYQNASSRHTASSLFHGTKVQGKLDGIRKEDYNPVALDVHGDVVNGNHRHAAATENQDTHLLALVPTGSGSGKIHNLEEAYHALTGTEVASRGGYRPVRLSDLGQENFAPKPNPSLPRGSEVRQKVGELSAQYAARHQVLENQVDSLSNQLHAAYEAAYETRHANDPAKDISLSPDQSRPFEERYQEYHQKVGEARKGTGWHDSTTEPANINQELNKVREQQSQLRTELTSKIHQQLQIPEDQRATIKINPEQSNASAVGLKKAKAAADWIASVTHKDVLPTGELTSSVKKINRNHRAYYDAGQVYLSEHHATKIYVHELGHALEGRSGKLLANAIEHRQIRTEGAGPAESLSKVTGRRAYASDEKTVKADFFDPYVGKIYPYNGATEIHSMALEHLYDNPAHLAKADPKLFDAVIDSLRGHTRRY